MVDFSLGNVREWKVVFVTKSGVKCDEECEEWRGHMEFEYAPGPSLYRNEHCDVLLKTRVVDADDSDRDDYDDDRKKLMLL